MAFTQSNSAPAAVARTNDDSWKAGGFLNLYLPGKNGERRKLGAVPLKAANLSQKELLAWLTEDPSRVANIMAKLEMEFQPVATAETAGFDLA